MKTFRTGKMPAPLAAKKAALKAKAMPPKESLRAAYADMARENEALSLELERAAETLEATRQHREELRSRNDGLQRQLTEDREIASKLKSDNEDLRARLEFAERRVIEVRAENEVARARGYIAGMKGEPFDRTVLDVSGPMNGERPVNAMRPINADGSIAMYGDKAWLDDHLKQPKAIR